MRTMNIDQLRNQIDANDLECKRKNKALIQDYFEHRSPFKKGDLVSFGYSNNSFGIVEDISLYGFSVEYIVARVDKGLQDLGRKNRLRSEALSLTTQEKIQATKLPTKTLQGKIVLLKNYEDDEAVCIISDPEQEEIDLSELEGEEVILSDTLEDWTKTYGQFVTLRYWLSPDEITSKEEIEAQATLTGMGCGSYEACYSEVTGYLWLTDEATIGGHNLRNELADKAGWYALMEFEFS